METNSSSPRLFNHSIRSLFPCGVGLKYTSETTVGVFFESVLPVDGCFAFFWCKSGIFQGLRVEYAIRDVLTLVELGAVFVGVASVASDFGVKVSRHLPTRAMSFRAFLRL